MITLDRDGALWRIVIGRAEKRGALTAEMVAQIASITEAAAAEAQVLVLTGTGDAFSAGADLAEAHSGLARDPVWERLSAAVAGFPGLSIAAINGTAAGGALGMVLACDLRVAVLGATFFYPVLRHGFVPPRSDPGRLVALVGPGRAKLILMGGARIDADEALRIGLIDRLVPREELDRAVAGLSEEALATRPDVLREVGRLCDRH
ncbi:enoyl-CoA hydratase/isomerase family protein [Mesobaculum littorinae]|uniref:Enoyl-CoA hydratase/isomerase family protein n=1 Tax=Mesobaculum littorinae TaxID=2486419 RepID=A0A438AHG3_9RHOB|nr:enoyl-CoA hydratase/isomerase family protein [Mesobaculum littorinae]RVV98055.1 enoyl-CoA hydratase/isomerase family protein [Mesobaculum littorinae]